MTDTVPATRDRITIAILALGGQGGGVLADWILDLAQANGYVAQGTSVPGVAQRTGSTVYYIELVRRPAAGANRPDPVLAMMPVPGDVDIVIASELMEAGRAILRGFVSAERTTLIGSTHRIYAISEKSATGDGIAAGQRILDAAERRARRFIGFDMDAAASDARSVISSVMFGALAGSDALPFARGAFEDAIRQGGKAVAANLKGFATGLDNARTRKVAIDAAHAVPEPTTPAGRAMRDRIRATLPQPAHALAIEGVRKLMDYQDLAYAALYLDRLAQVYTVDDGREDHRLTTELARYLALAMAYDDTIRVADLKVRALRSARVAREVQVAPDQVMTVTEYMHPRLQEVCETLPAWLGAAILDHSSLRRLLEPFFSGGRHVRTTGLRWFVTLRALAALRRFRRSTLRYAQEQVRVADWLGLVVEAASHYTDLATEIVVARRLVKGYGETFERTFGNFECIMTAARGRLDHAGSAGRIRALRDAALADDSGDALRTLLNRDTAREYSASLPASLTQMEA